MFIFRTEVSTSKKFKQIRIDFVNNDFNDNLKHIRTFLDLAKKFGTVNHDMLLLKVENLEIRRKALNVINHIFKEDSREQELDQHIVSRNINCGVSQGTVLGPILFPLYLNTTGKCIKNEVVICYAMTAIVLRKKLGRS